MDINIDVFLFKVSQRGSVLFPQLKITMLTISLPAHQKEKYSMFLIYVNLKFVFLALFLLGP